MPTLKIRFPAKRYHATPWGHHVNEGIIEWPPSPWRLLRALLATGYAKARWNGDRPPAVARALIEKLASVLPVYDLPPMAGAHSRHYMPLGRFKKGQEDRTLVFDTWGRICEGALFVTWNVHLEAAETRLLARLAEQLNYLGRSESWVDAQLLPADKNTGEGNCFPSDEAPPPGWEQIPLLAPQSKEAYATWRKSAATSALADLPLPESSQKKPSKTLLAKRKKAMAPYPKDLIACLQATTPRLHQQGWSRPPGSRKILYRRPIDAIEAGAPRLRHRKVMFSTVQFMLLSMTAESRNDHALPAVNRTLPQAEQIHRALVSRSNGMGEYCPVLTGCDGEKKPLRGPHRHAHVLPLDLNRDGHLDHVLLWAPGGIDAVAQRVVRSIRRTYTKVGIEPLRLAVVGTGNMENLRSLPAEYGRSMNDILGPERGATEWVSLTPFVAPRYLKKSGRNTLFGQVGAELASRGLPEPEKVSILDPGRHSDFLYHRHFIRKRRKGPQPPADFGYSLKLRLKTPVTGPLCLGYAGHFGMGLFRAVVGGSVQTGP